MAQRHHDIHRHVAGRQPADGAEGLLAALPQFEAHGLLLGQTHLARSAAQQPVACAQGILGGLLLLARELENHGRGHVRGEPEAEGRLDGLEHRLVDHLDRHGQQAVAENPADGAHGFVQVGEKSSQRDVGCGMGHQLQVGRRDHTQGAFAAAQQRQQIDAPLAGQAAARGPGAPPCVAPLEPQQMLPRDAVAQAMRPARVLGDVAADRGRALAAGIGREVQAVRGRVRADLAVQHADADADTAVHRIDRVEMVQAGGRQDDLAVRGHRAAAQAGAGTARYQGQTACGAPAHDLGDGVGISRQRHGQRTGLRDVGGIPGVDQPRGGVGQQAVFAEQPGQGIQNGAGARHDSETGGRRRDSRRCGNRAIPPNRSSDRLAVVGSSTDVRKVETKSPPMITSAIE